MTRTLIACAVSAFIGAALTGLGIAAEPARGRFSVRKLNRDLAVLLEAVLLPVPPVGLLACRAQHAA